MTVSVWLAVAAFGLSLYGTYDLVYRRVQAKRKMFSDADRAVVTSAIELIEPYRARVNELVRYTADLEARLRVANEKVDTLLAEVRDLQLRLNDMQGHR